jgi:hypothetical protein
MRRRKVTHGRPEDPRVSTSDGLDAVTVDDDDGHPIVDDTHASRFVDGTDSVHCTPTRWRVFGLLRAMARTRGRISTS